MTGDDDELDAVFVMAMNYVERLAVSDDGVVGRIDSFLDFEGDETDDLAEAEAAIIEWPDGTWSPVPMCEYELRLPS